MLIDSHCHIYMKDYDADRAAVLDRCRAEGLRAVVVIGAGSEERSNAEALKLAREHDFIWATVGVHPHDARVCTDETYKRCAEWVEENPKVVAVGETGLDFHYDLSSREVQETVFRRFIGLARELKKPLVIHDREAHELCLNILREEHAEEIGGIYHCFSGDVGYPRGGLALGFYIGMGGGVPFKKAPELQETARLIPLDRIVLETDAPYLAPIPHRGRRCEPWMIKLAAAKIAELRGIAVEEVVEATGLAACRVYGLDPAALPPAPTIAIIPNG